MDFTHQIRGIQEKPETARVGSTKRPFAATWELNTIKNTQLK